MARFTKADVELHSDMGRQRNPAVNIKAHSFGGRNAVDAIMVRFGCDEATAEKALGWAFEMAQEIFWEDAIDLAGEVFGPAYGYHEHQYRRVWAEGRSGGWLVVHGLGNPDMINPCEDWDAIMVGRWGRFARDLEAEVEYRSSIEVIIEDIEANEWATPVGVKLDAMAQGAMCQ